MHGKKLKLPLTTKTFEEISKNFADICDLSDSESEDDSGYVNSIHSTTDSDLNRYDNAIIEQRLKHIFGFYDNMLNDDEETTTIQDQQISTDSLLSILEETPDNTI